MPGSETPHFSEPLQRQFHIRSHWHLSCGFRLGVSRPQGNKSPLEVHAFPGQVDDFTEALPQLVRSQQERSHMWLRCLVQFRPFFLGQYPISGVFWVWQGYTSSRIALKQSTSDCNIEAVLQHNVIIIDGLNARRGPITFLPLSAERLHV